MSETRNGFSPEVRERTVRMVGEHRADYGSEWEPMTSIAAEILRKASAYFAQAEFDRREK